MLDPQLVINILIVVIIIVSVYAISASIRVYLQFRSDEEMHKALSYLRTNIATGHGNLVVALTMFANALPRNDRDWAIYSLVSLATLNNNSEALLAIRDHIRPKDLIRALNNRSDGDLKNCIRGEVIGRLNGMKLICFAMGTRTIQHLDANIADAEYIMLKNQFGVAWEAPNAVRLSTTG